MNEISHVITLGKACPETKAKYLIARKYIQKQKRINAIILSITIVSFVIYTLCLFYLYVENWAILEYIIIGLNIMLLCSLGVALSMFISSASSLYNVKQKCLIFFSLSPLLFLFIPNNLLINTTSLI